MYKDPTLNDQTAWFTLDNTQLLRDEIEAVRELIELEPESAWALQTLVHFLNQLILRAPQSIDVESVNSEILSNLDKLIEIDSDREFRYKDKSTSMRYKYLTDKLIILL
jgi:geranylgeranyl transferase type-2 subunit alpha